MSHTKQNSHKLLLGLFDLFTVQEINNNNSNGGISSCHSPDFSNLDQILYLSAPESLQTPRLYSTLSVLRQSFTLTHLLVP